jgi:hypothetical protein
LRVAVDGGEAGKISGEIAWQQRALTLGLGAHTVRWSSTKDRSGARGQDQGWVDQVAFTVTPPPTTLYVDWRNATPNPNGSVGAPYPTLAQGVQAVANCGTVNVRAGSYAYPARLFTKCMRLESYDGLVKISPSGVGQLDASGPLGQLSQPARQADGSLAFSFNCVQGARCQVLTSTNLVNWEVWKDFTAEDDTTAFVAPDPASEPMRFFRVSVP